MTETQRCASYEQLESAARGEHLEKTLASHISSCTECAGRLEEVRVNNLLAGELTAIEDAPGPEIDRAPSLQKKGYRIIRELHRGGQGVVFLGKHTPTGRRVAIKTLLLGTRATPRQQARFEREAELLAGLRHSGIVTIFDSGITDRGQAYLVMEYLEGRPMDAWLADPESGPARTMRERLRLFEQLCDAVDAAHVRGVIHRDLKPENILIDAQNAPHVLDFGIARAIERTGGSEATRTGDFIGTLVYAAPEQLERDPDRIDTRADVYALGLILFELLTGSRARPTGISVVELTRLAQQSPPRPSTVHKPIADDLDAITIKALRPDRERRYQSAAALRDDVRRYLEGRAIEAKRGQSWYIARKFVERHAIPISAAAVLLTVLLGATILSLKLLSESRIETAKANSIRVFLEDTLGSVGPDPEGGDPTVGKVLDEAVHWIEIALADEPEVAASLHDTIGNSYRVLGRFSDAERQIAASIEIRQGLFGDDHPQFATSLNRMAMLRADQGNLDDAERLARDALAIRERFFGANSEPVVSSLMNLGSILHQTGRLDESIEMYERSLTARSKPDRDPGPDVAMCEFRLGQAYSDRDSASSRAHHERSLEIRRATLHANHPDLRRSIEAVANARILAGAPGAIDLATQLVEIQTEAHGSASWESARAMLLLARALEQSGSRLEGLRTAERARGIFVESLGEQHEFTLEADGLISRFGAPP